MLSTSDILVISVLVNFALCVFLILMARDRTSERNQKNAIKALHDRSLAASLPASAATVSLIETPEYGLRQALKREEWLQSKLARVFDEHDRAMADLRRSLAEQLQAADLQRALLRVENDHLQDSLGRLTTELANARRQLGQPNKTEHDLVHG